MQNNNSKHNLKIFIDDVDFDSFVDELIDRIIEIVLDEIAKEEVEERRSMFKNYRK